MTIELPDNLAKKLIAIGKELAKQDNRSTAWPVWYVTEINKKGEREFASYGSVSFLTAKACQEYIDANDYHFNKPAAYADSAHRNHELQPIIQALILIAGEKVPSNHYGRVDA